MPLDVLVYQGPGVSETSLYHTLTTLDTLLRPNYTVRAVDAKLLETEPWGPSCALLAIPGGRDLPYVEHLAKAIPKIKEFVENGGAYLGICAGAYFGSARVEWELGTPLQVVGERPLKFFPGTSRGCAYPGFEYQSEAGAQLLDITATVHGEESEQTFEGIYYNGGGVFEDADTPQMRALGVLVTARYPNGKPAAVTCAVGRGAASLWGLHPEYAIPKEPYRSALENSSQKDLDNIAVRESRRLELMRGVLAGLGLTVPGGSASTKLSDAPLPQLLCASPDRPGVVGSIVSAFNQYFKSGNDSAKEFEDSQDKFRFFSSHSDRTAIARKEVESKTEEQKKRSPKSPLFETLSSLYFKALHGARGNSPFIKQTNWGVGEVLLYGEVVTSTQTLFDKNINLLTTLPHPVLSLATIQTAGRGRGSNVWLSPLGCLQYSLLIRPSRDIPYNRTVFIQYLFGLAITEACRKVMPGPEGERVRLKWPNDIYVLEADGKTKKKIGGILITTNFMDNTMHVVIGSGLNVLNQPPIMSLKQLYPQGTTNPNLTMENIAANIMATFEDLWRQFTEAKGSFEPFMDLYLERWLHSDEQVTLMTTNPPTKVRIFGISPDTGFLRTIPEQGGDMKPIDLQPDGNSFDMMAGLIKTKS
ncbi:biotin-[acetyl-CoA-carboxylase] ligase [Rhizoctonia solani]|uniref:Biotin-[acetyl-CoA-carboxylase] ligase n=1 Tax=Rhizoctonia solani TaxID=456999 RepID=A0A8H8P7M3_9AGAM|nr:biotin-[acetyl-CoA-carboxylase] ligase [Rhizoctonia solani]QRW25792.1 biotin-[acetyl-CoA-carboxylase] ligase [Rhizoctonia solani]